MNHAVVLGSYLALACAGGLAPAGCGGAGEEQVATDPVAIEIRFHQGSSTGDSTGASAASKEAPLAALVAPDVTSYDEVARILVDISLVDGDTPYYTNFELVEIADNMWRGDVPLLPRNKQLRFAARALNAAGATAFSGDTLATLTINNQGVEIPLAPIQDDQTFQMPRMFRIAYPSVVYSGQEEQIVFTIEGTAGTPIDFRLSAASSPTTPSANFLPAVGTVTLTNTVADFMAVFTPPSVSAETELEYQVTITAANAQAAVAVTTNFKAKVRPRSADGDIVTGAQPSVVFYPVVLSLTANGSTSPGTVGLVAEVSDDSAPTALTYEWSYTPNAGTPAATFANSQINPGVLEGYTVEHQGTITLAVTDEDDGTTTLHYQVKPNQFADAISHTPTNGVKSIVSGAAHTCALTGKNQVRCWGDNQYGQLGYGNTIDVGDAPTRLPYTAGDVPLPSFDPVMQLAAGYHHTCALTQTGMVRCWGRNDSGQLGYGRIDHLGDGEPVTAFGYVTLGGLATRIAAGGDHTCAILQGGALRCWGRNDFGQLGRGNQEKIGDNEAVYSAGNVDLGAGVSVKDVALGGHHTCALLTTGSVRCWGRNSYGQLGYGNTVHRGDDEPISNLPNVSMTGTVRKVVAGGDYTCALTDAGTLRCWGYGYYGQLGSSAVPVFGSYPYYNYHWSDTPNELPSNLPSDINFGAKVTDVVAGEDHTCALSGIGVLKCWGRGATGQLGYGNYNDQHVPAAAGINLDGVSSYRISTGAGTAHTCALRSNGTVRCWGYGADGRLGRGSTANSATATGDVNVQVFAP